MTDKTLQDRLRDWARVGPAREMSNLMAEAADALDAQEARIKALEGALREIIDRWDTPLWKDAEPTGAVINRARALLGEK